ncbi:nucleoside-diphosphate kinase [Candidatus Saccharibacteria bacterium]|jgi:nucleoside-diphosphate kinase|nr:nucleoside-diphosphate kinase [Candidatus Saccharibacteria bacterium]
MANEIQRTLVLFKPDAVQRGVVGEILSRFERVGLKIVATKMISPDEDHYRKHYEDIGKMISRRGEHAFDVTMKLMVSGPVIAIVFEGVEAIALVRKLVGATEPKSADPGTIRGDYSHMSFGYADSQEKGIPNLIHASGDEADAEQEIAHWFAESEIYEYEKPSDKFIR